MLADCFYPRHRPLARLATRARVSWRGDRAQVGTGARAEARARAQSQAGARAGAQARARAGAGK